MVCVLIVKFEGLKVLCSPLQTPRACGISLPARKTNASPNSGSVTGRTTARTALMRVPRSAVSAVVTARNLLLKVTLDKECTTAVHSAGNKWTETGKNPNEATDNPDGFQ